MESNDIEEYQSTSDNDVFELNVKNGSTIVARNTFRKNFRCGIIKQKIISHCDKYGSKNFSDFYEENNITVNSIELIMINNSILDFSFIKEDYIDYIYVSVFEGSGSKDINILFREGVIVDKIIFAKVSLEFFLNSAKNMVNICRNFYWEGKYFTIEKNETNFLIFKELAELNCNVYCMNRVKNSKEDSFNRKLMEEIVKKNIPETKIHSFSLELRKSFPETFDDIFCIEDSIITCVKDYFYSNMKAWELKILYNKIESQIIFNID